LIDQNGEYRGLTALFHSMIQRCAYFKSLGHNQFVWVVITGHIPTPLSAATVSFNAEITYQNFMAHLSNLHM
jgi:hypothetical protein